VIYSLDTNVCIALINGSSHKARGQFIQAVLAQTELTVCSVALHELWYGVAKSKRVDANGKKLTEFLSRDLKILHFSEQDAQVAGDIRAQLERRGKRIGEYDTLIAGQALARGLTLVTANTREFSRVDGLKLVDWS
jgi:tRNA(fMet)-specific endonuclease VapC